MKRIHLALVAAVVLCAAVAGTIATNWGQHPALAADDEPFFENHGWFKMDKRVTMKLDGMCDWCDTGVQLMPGQEMRIVASGLIAFKTDYNRTPLRRLSPAGDKSKTDEPKAKDGIDYFKAKLPAPDLTPFALIGRIVDVNGTVKVPPFEIGADMTMPVPAEGELQITSNDDSHFDDQGHWLVTVLTRKQPGTSVEPFGKDKAAPPAGN
ncbi:MAG: hypothetical protein ACREJ2_05395 [Planctomycetota bacterium]